MIVICAWCKASLGEKEPLADKHTTHSICGTCRTKLLARVPEHQRQANVELHDTAWGVVAIGDGLDAGTP
jgi:hypothetical protein